ncbi:MAG: Fe-S cluster assembly protein SufD [Candidatus Aenigmarchaeota archaeon]|nr:Fe-S cluster assembly protein SufD [Candidatus Aenigmarchaeota archaeon]
MALEESDVRKLSVERSEPAWLLEQRLAAFKQFSALQLPSAKDESWKYTSLRGFDFAKAFAASGPAKLQMTATGDSVVCCSLTEAVRKFPELVRQQCPARHTYRDKFDALAAAFWSDGYFLQVPDGAQADIHLAISGSGRQTAVMRNFIILGNGAKASFHEELGMPAGDSQLAHVSMTETRLAEGSALEAFHFQDWPANVWDVSFQIATVGKDASLICGFAQFGSATSRLVMDTALAGEGATADLTGVFLGSNSQHVDIVTNARHLVPHTSSNILARGVLKDAASGVYRGLIKIEKEAQQTLSYLADNTLLVGGQAVANSIPSLMIDANDVKASHGATVGQADAEQLFYLMARGLPQPQAEAILVQGFLEPALAKIKDQALRQRCRRLVEERIVA